jgi:cold shock protein
VPFVSTSFRLFKEFTGFICEASYARFLRQDLCLARGIIGTCVRACKRSENMAKGKIKRIVPDRGFGFIEGPHRKDVFFHHSSVANGGFDDLAQGQEVEFEIDELEKGDKGPRAKNVRPV